MDNWPVSLQQKLEASGFDLKYGSTVVSTDMAVGPAKKRSRFTDGVDVYSCQITLDFDEKSVFDTFYKTTIANGTLPFLFTDPFTETEQTFRFAPGTDPVLRPLGGRVFVLNMTWEKLP